MTNKQKEFLEHLLSNKWHTLKPWNTHEEKMVTSIAKKFNLNNLLNEIENESK